jgi:hypothetical protein
MPGLTADVPIATSLDPPIDCGETTAAAAAAVLAVAAAVPSLRSGALSADTPLSPAMDRGGCDSHCEVEGGGSGDGADPIDSDGCSGGDGPTGTDAFRWGNRMGCSAPCEGA